MAEQKEVHIVSEEGIRVEYSIGATISIEGKICKVVEEEGISYCYHDCILARKEKGIRCRNLACLDMDRKDRKNVHFEEIKDYE